MATISYAKWKDLFQRGSLCDVELSIGESSIPVHGLILSVVSQSFANLIKEAREKHTGKGPLQVKIDDDPLPILKALLNYIYTNEVLLEDMTVLDLLRAAKRYELERLVSMCTAHLSKNLAPSATLRIAFELPAGEEKDLVMHRLRKQAKDIFKSPDLLELSESTLIELVKDSHLEIPEVAVFEGVVRWGKAQVKKREEEKKKAAGGGEEKKENEDGEKEKVEDGGDGSGDGKKDEVVDEEKKLEEERKAVEEEEKKLRVEEERIRKEEEELLSEKKSSRKKKEKKGRKKDKDKKDKEEEEVEEKEAAVDPAALKEAVKDIVPHVRFPLMTLQEFVLHVVTSGVLGEEDVIGLFTYFSKQLTSDADPSPSTDNIEMTDVPEYRMPFSTEPRQPDADEPAVEQDFGLAGTVLDEDNHVPVIEPASAPGSAPRPGIVEEEDDDEGFGLFG